MNESDAQYIGKGIAAGGNNLGLGIAWAGLWIGLGLAFNSGADIVLTDSPPVVQEEAE